jgi:hypothetical protein
MRQDHGRGHRVRELDQDLALARGRRAGDGVQRRDRGELQRLHEVEDRIAILAAPDRGVELDRDDVGAVLQRPRGAGVVAALVTPDPVMDLEGVAGDRLDGMKGDDLAVRCNATELRGEGGDAALARGVGRDEGDAGDGRAPIAAEMRSGPPPRKGRSRCR